MPGKDSTRSGTGQWLNPLPITRVSSSPSLKVNTSSNSGKIAPKKEAVTMASSPNLEVSIKHPLENSWTLWYFKNGHSKIWAENQIEITTVTTIEDFWAIINYTKKASEISPQCDYR